MNRGFLIALVPPILVAIVYLLAGAMLGWPLAYARILAAAVGAVAAVFIVNHYTRRKARPTRK